MMIRLASVCLMLVALGRAQAPQVMGVDLLEAKLKEKIRAVDRNLDGAMGVAVIDLTSGRTILLNSDTLFATASVIKVPILVETFRQARAGEINLQERITLDPSETVGGSGLLQETLKKGPVTLSVLELATKMIEDSDNTATNRVIRMVKMERVNRRTQELNLPATRLRRIMLDTEAATKGMENITTPLEMTRLMEMIYRGKACQPDDCKEMLRILKLVKGEIRTAVPATVDVASKTGGLVGVKCETAIVFHPKRPFAVSVFGSFLTGEESPVGAVAKLVYEHFDRLGSANAYGNRAVR